MAIVFFSSLYDDDNGPIGFFPNLKRSADYWFWPRLVHGSGLTILLQTEVHQQLYNGWHRGFHGPLRRKHTYILQHRELMHFVFLGICLHFVDGLPLGTDF